MLKGALRCRCNIVGPKSDLDTLVDRCLVKMCDPGGLPEREINKDTRLSMCAAEQYIHCRLLITTGPTVCAIAGTTSCATWHGLLLTRRTTWC